MLFDPLERKMNILSLILYFVLVTGTKKKEGIIEKGDKFSSKQFEELEVNIPT